MLGTQAVTCGDRCTQGGVQGVHYPGPVPPPGYTLLPCRYYTLLPCLDQHVHLLDVPGPACAPPGRPWTTSCRLPGPSSDHLLQASWTLLGPPVLGFLDVPGPPFEASRTLLGPPFEASRTLLGPPWALLDVPGPPWALLDVPGPPVEVSKGDIPGLFLTLLLVRSRARNAPYSH